MKNLAIMAGFNKI